MHDLAAHDLRADALLECLCELEPAPTLRQLRDDPSGRSWLPPALREAILEQPELRRVLADFVEEERALVLDAERPVDPFFTARVMAKVPRPELSPVLRQRVLGLAYLCAAAVAGTHAASWVASVGARAWLDPWHAWLDALSVGGVVTAAALLISAVALVWPSGWDARQVGAR